MKGVVDPIDVRAIGKDEWLLLEPFDWHGITVPKDFKTNFGSIPGFIRWWINPTGHLRVGYLVHDWLYHLRGKLPTPIVRKGVTKTVLTRNECDYELYSIGKAIGYNRLKNQAVYRGLQVGGWVSWNRAG